MWLDRRFVVVALCFAFSRTAAAVVGEQCALVDCDCEVFAEEKWGSECQAREQAVISQCQAGSGEIQSYCGLHGPAAHPVATSIQALRKTPAAEGSSSFVLKQVDTQNWSLGETYNAFVAALEHNQYSRAMQLAKLLEDDSEKLFNLQKQAVRSLVDAGKVRDAQSLAAEYALGEAEHGAAMVKLSEQLWQKIATGSQRKEQRAAKVLSFKTARAAAAVYEYAGELYADADASAKAANLWQRSAAVAQKLIGWESITENNPRHISFYQAQASARWYRATFHWLNNNNPQQVAQSNAQARAYIDGVAESVATVPADHLHTVDQDDMRAIKRGE